MTKAGPKIGASHSKPKTHREPRSCWAVYLRDTDPDKGLPVPRSRTAAQKNRRGAPTAAPEDAPTEAGSPVSGRTGSNQAARMDHPSSAQERRSRWVVAGPCRTLHNRAAGRNLRGRIPGVRCWNGEGNDLVHLAGAADIGRRNRCLEGGRGNLKY